MKVLRISCLVAGLGILAAIDASAQQPLASSPAPPSAPSKLEVTLGGGINFVGGEEATRGFTFSGQSVYRFSDTFRVVPDTNYQFSQLTHPHSEVITQHFFG